jgi:hypothetical protein
MSQKSLLVPSGVWLIFVLAWAVAVGALLYFGTTISAAGAAALDCGPSPAPQGCLVEREAWWFWSTLRTTAVPYVVLGILLPLAAQAAVRVLARKFGWGAAAG